MEDNKNIVELDLNDILPNRFQPRIKFNEDSIIELSESIKEHGVLQAIIVRPIGDKYEIVAGERRYKAAVLAGLDTIPSRVLSLDDKNSAEIALIENVQRRDLSPIEEAISYKKILDMGYITQEQLAAKLGRSQSTIANKIRLLNLCDEVQEALMEEKISERHARSLLKLSSFDDQRSLLKRIVKERLTVRKTDEEISKLLLGSSNEPSIESNKETQSTDKTEVINPGFVDVDKIKDTAEDLDIEDTVIDISSLFEDDELDEAHVEEPTTLKKDEVIDTSLFSKFLTPEPVAEEEKEPVYNPNILVNKPKDDVVNEEQVSPVVDTEVATVDNTVANDETTNEVVEQPIVQQAPVIIESTNNEEVKEEVGETNNMMNTEYNDIYNQKIGNPEDIVPVEHFGKFFDPSYFDEEEVNKAPETPVLNLSNDGPAPSTIFNTDITPVKPDLMAVQHPDGTINSNPMANTSVTPNLSSLLQPEPPQVSTELPPMPEPTPVVQPTSEQPSTMFPNLMNNTGSVSEKDFIDENTFNQMLDPTYVDGQKQEAPVGNPDIIDVSVFSKFLDPDYDVNKDEIVRPEGSDLAPVMPAPVEPVAPVPTVEQTGNVAPEPVQQDNAVIPTISFAQFMDGASPVPAPAPTVEPTVPTIEPSIQAEQTVESQPIDVVPILPIQPDVPATEEVNNMNNNQSMGMPDLLAPMGATPAPVQPAAISEPTLTVANTSSAPLTPDLSFNQPAPVEPEVKPAEEVVPVEETPVFVTASTPAPDVAMPSNPIIDNPEASAILGSTPAPVEPVVPVEQPAVAAPMPEPEPVIPTTINPAIGTLENQPIIVTDYNKQYDPIIPNAPVSTGPKVDLKQVIAMIRDLNDKIEGYGFNIDTEEYDLDGMYQVIFKIEKQ